jgi:PIN domain nuclease of toxin-antitoxin system
MAPAAPLLLDTCTTLWISNDDPIAESARDALSQARRGGEGIYVSPITAWEIGLLVARDRISLMMSPLRWFLRLLEAPGLRLAEMPPDLLITSSFLPGTPPRDPADRIIAATAREYRLVLMTRDQPLLDYAAQGHLTALGC